MIQKPGSSPTSSSKRHKLAGLVNNLVKQVKKRMKLLPYEITKCFADPFA